MVLGVVASQGIGLLVSIISARLLGKVQFGELTLVRSTVLMLGVFVGSALGTTVAKYVSEHRNQDVVRCGRLIGYAIQISAGLGTVLISSSFVFGSDLADLAMGDRHLTLPLQLGTILVLLNVLSGIQQGILLGLESFRTLSVLLAAEAVVTLVGTSIGAMSGGLTGCLVGMVLASLTNIALRGFVVKLRISQNGIVLLWRGRFADMSVLWNFALPSLLIGVIVSPSEWLSRLFLARTPNGLGELALFSAAYSWGTLVLFLPNQIASPSLPILSNLYAKGDRAAFLDITILALSLALISGGTVATVIALNSDWIMRFYGDSFSSSAGILPLLLIAYVIASLTILGSVFAACGHMWWQLLHYGTWGLTLLACAFLWRAHGAAGLASSYIVAYAVLLVSQILFAMRLLVEARDKSASGNT